MKKIEYCTNSEWLCQRLDLPEGSECWQNEIAKVYIDEATSKLEQDIRIINFDLDRARNQRILYHGWNGAQFTHFMGIFGSFTKLTTNEVDACYEADEYGRIKAEEFARKIIERNTVSYYNDISS